jgi:hypothetical protein
MSPKAAQCVSLDRSMVRFMCQLLPNSRDFHGPRRLFATWIEKPHFERFAERHKHRQRAYSRGEKGERRNRCPASYEEIELLGVSSKYSRSD